MTQGNQFGLALARMNVPVPAIADFLDIPAFRVAEVPIELFAEPQYNALQRRLDSHAYDVVYAGNLMNSALTQEILTATTKLRVEFVEQAVGNLRFAAANHCRAASLDFPVQQILASDDAQAVFRDIFLRMTAPLMDAGITLLLPFRIPGPLSPTRMAKFLRDTLNPGVKVCFEIHPHEQGHDFSPDESAGFLHFETGAVVFTYDADSGNKMTKSLFMPWVEFFNAHQYHGPFFFCPKSARNRMALPEADTLAKMVEGV